MQFSITYKLPISNATSAERGARWTLQPRVNRALRSIMQAYIYGSVIIFTYVTSYRLLFDLSQRAETGLHRGQWAYVYRPNNSTSVILAI
jgi:hypothetical protein